MVFQLSIIDQCMCVRVFVLYIQRVCTYTRRNTVYALAIFLSCAAKKFNANDISYSTVMYIRNDSAFNHKQKSTTISICENLQILNPKRSRSAPTTAKSNKQEQ